MIFGRAVCGDWRGASGREWLVTNGLGGYACGTIAFANTRRYHGLLIASLVPPGERTLLVAKFDAAVEYDGRRFELGANEFTGGAIAPRGFVHIESFALRDGVPTWRYAFADALLEMRLFMAPLASRQSPHSARPKIKAALPRAAQRPDRIPIGRCELDLPSADLKRKTPAPRHSIPARSARYTATAATVSAHITPVIERALPS